MPRKTPLERWSALDRIVKFRALWLARRNKRRCSEMCRREGNCAVLCCGILVFLQMTTGAQDPFSFAAG